MGNCPLRRLTLVTEPTPHPGELDALVNGARAQVQTIALVRRGKWLEQRLVKFAGRISGSVASAFSFKRSHQPRSSAYDSLLYGHRVNHPNNTSTNQNPEVIPADS